MKVKTKDLTGAALDWAVMKCEHPKNDSVGFFNELRNEDSIYSIDLKRTPTGRFRYSERWDQGGPIIECKQIFIWTTYGGHEWHSKMDGWANEHVVNGSTPLVAAMRCYVKSTNGDEVEIPDELTT